MLSLKERAQQAWLERELNTTEKATDAQQCQFTVGDLVLLRDVRLDQIHGHKFEPRWLGPYRVDRVLSKHRSALLNDIFSQRRVGKHHFNHLRLFVPRRECTKWAEAETLAGMGKTEKAILKNALAMQARVDEGTEIEE